MFVWRAANRAYTAPICFMLLKIPCSNPSRYRYWNAHLPQYSLQTVWERRTSDTPKQMANRLTIVRPGCQRIHYTNLLRILYQTDNCTSLAWTDRTWFILIELLSNEMLFMQCCNELPQLVPANPNSHHLKCIVRQSMYYTVLRQTCRSKNQPSVRWIGIYSQKSRAIYLYPERLV